MVVDWSSAELSLMGGAWIGSQASDHIYTLGRLDWSSLGRY